MSLSNQIGKLKETITRKSIYVQTNVVKRLMKDFAYYKMEVETQKEKITSMELGGKDPYDINKQGEILGESYMMVHDTEERIEKAVIKLETSLQVYEDAYHDTSDGMTSESDSTHEDNTYTGKDADTILNDAHTMIEHYRS